MCVSLRDSSKVELDCIKYSGYEVLLYSIVLKIDIFFFFIILKKQTLFIVDRHELKIVG